MHSYLSTLANKSDLKAIAIERWNLYPPAIASVSVDLGEELSAKVASLETVAEYHDFSVVFVELDANQRTERQRLSQFLRSAEREVIKCFPPEKRNTTMFVFAAEQGNYWHFVNAGGADSMLRLRRFTLGPDNRDKLFTAHTQLDILQVDSGDSAEIVLGKFEGAFSVEAVSARFYKHFLAVFDSLRAHLVEQKGNLHQAKAHRFAHQLLNRLMFLYFVQRKSCFGKDINFLRTYWNAYRDNYDGSHQFYNQWLKPLFFDALNGKHIPREWLKLGPEYPDFNAILQLAPYLNGGLFKPNEFDDLSLTVADKQFQLIFEFLEKYNFTIQESSTLDQELAIDPEMMGNIYEMLVNASAEEDEQHQAGIFYTPKVEIEFMLRRSLVEFFSNKTAIDRETLYSFVFSHPGEQAELKLTPEEVSALLTELESITIVDPACGSGHYLVAAAQIIWELRSELLGRQGRTINKFEEKQRIIEQSIFGVDVKEWATEIAKLRLWLDLFVDADEDQLFSPVPLLPSLGFKIRVGDSLVQKISGVYFSPAHVHGLPVSLRALFNHIKESKTRYFRNDPYTDEYKVRAEELGLHRAIIDEQVEHKKRHMIDLRSSLATLKMEQLTLGGVAEPQQQRLALREAEKDQKKIDALDAEIDILEEQKNQLSHKSKFAFWPIEFAEIFSERGGFDIVIANPPYVRQELIGDPAVQGEQPLAARQEYKAKLQRQLQIDWHDEQGKLIKLSKNSDLYVYFYLKGLALLNQQGIMCFISSNSWLDVGYGKNLQEILLKRVPVIAVYDNQVQRSFKHAAVNTIIAVLDAPQEHDWQAGLADNIVRFVNFKKPFEEVAQSEVLIGVEKHSRRENTQLYNIHPISQGELWLDGAEKAASDSGQSQLAMGHSAAYAGNKWGGKYLRAPDIYWHILEKCGDKLVRLGDIAEVRFGIKTGANEFFYLDAERIAEWCIEEEFLKPVIKSPRECKTIVVNPDDLKYKVFMCHKSKVELKGTAALEYIKWGEQSRVINGAETGAFHLRPSCAGRARWWDLGERLGARLNCNYQVDKVMRFFLGSTPNLVSDNFQEIHYDNSEQLALALNSTFSQMIINMLGRSNFGDGLLKIQTYEVANITVVDPRMIPPKSARELMLTSKLLSLEGTDRRAIDKVLFDVLGLTQTERDAVYETVIDLVNKRLERAASI